MLSHQWSQTLKFKNTFHEKELKVHTSGHQDTLCPSAVPDETTQRLETQMRVAISNSLFHEKPTT